MSLVFRGMAAAVALAVMIGCDGAGRNDGPPAAPEDSLPPASAAPSPDAPRTVLMLGTSLTAGLGLQPEDAFPARVQEQIDAAGLPFRVVNAGVSGETSAGALRRLDWLMRQEFDVLVLETGANDMLRGMDLDSTRANIEAIVDRVRAQRPAATIVIAGMLAPPNLGRAYAEQFRDLYQEVAAENDLPFIPFLLDGVGGEAAMNQEDGIHPNEEGAKRVAENVWAVLGPILRERADPSATPAAVTEAG